MPEKQQIEGNFLTSDFSRTVGAVERMHVPFSVWVLPITGLGPGQWGCISHGSKPFFRSSPTSSKTSNSKAYWGWLWESGAGFRDIWSGGRARVLLFCRRPQAEAALLSPLECHNDDNVSSSCLSLEALLCTEERGIASSWVLQNEIPGGYLTFSLTVILKLS